MAHQDEIDADDDASSNKLVQERLCAIVARSHVLGIESKTEQEQTNDVPPMAYSSSLSSLLLDAKLFNDDSDGVLPPYDLLASVAHPPAVQCRKFFADLHPLDRILARIVRPGVALLHVELVCMLSRFRRTLLTFMKGRLNDVPSVFYSSSLPSPLLDANLFNFDSDFDGVLFPYSLLFSVAHPHAVQCRKFFADLKIVRPGVAVLHVDLVCMLSRFRRTQFTFVKGQCVRYDNQSIFLKEYFKQ